LLIAGIDLDHRKLVCFCDPEAMLEMLPRAVRKIYLCHFTFPEKKKPPGGGETL
jgi:hypothetical protein